MDWALMLVPLLVLPIVLLFRFVGCNTVLDLDVDDNQPPRYRDFILGMFATSNPGGVRHPTVVPARANVIGYWRLLDPDTIAVSGDVRTQAPAKDETGFQHGVYATQNMPAEAANGDLGSEFAEGRFTFGQPSLIVSDPNQHCRLFLGGYVIVPFKQAGSVGLYTHDFTIEAWIEPKWGANVINTAHVLFAAGGFYRPALDPLPSAAQHGFSVFIDGQNRCQVRLAPKAGDLFVSPPPPLIPLDRTTHIALTVGTEGAQKRVRLFLNGIETNTVTVSSYFPPFDAPLYIGAGNKTGDPAGTPVHYRPIISRVQEVVLHNKALSVEEIQNHVDINR